MISTLKQNELILRNITSGLGPTNQTTPFPCGICNKNVNKKQFSVINATNGYILNVIIFLIQSIKFLWMNLMKTNGYACNAQ